MDGAKTRTKRRFLKTRPDARTEAQKEDMSGETRTYGNPNYTKPYLSNFRISHSFIFHSAFYLLVTNYDYNNDSNGPTEMMSGTWRWWCDIRASFIELNVIIINSTTPIHVMVSISRRRFGRSSSDVRVSTAVTGDFTWPVTTQSY